MLLSMLPTKLSLPSTRVCWEHNIENASKHYNYEKVRRMIERQTEKHGWELLFLGANIDAAAEAKRFGIREDRAVG